MILSGVRAATGNWIFFPPSICTDDILRSSIPVHMCLLHCRPTFTDCCSYKQSYKRVIAITISTIRALVPHNSIAMSVSNECRECIRRAHLQTRFNPFFRRNRAPLESEPSAAARSSVRSCRRPAGALGFRSIRSWRPLSLESRRNRVFDELSPNSGGTW